MRLQFRSIFGEIVFSPVLFYPSFEQLFRSNNNTLVRHRFCNFNGGAGIFEEDIVVENHEDGAHESVLVVTVGRGDVVGTTVLMFR